MMVVGRANSGVASNQAFAYGNSGNSNPLLMLGNGASANRLALRVRDTAGTDVTLAETGLGDWGNFVHGAYIGSRSEARNNALLFANGAVTLDTTAGSAVGSTSFDRTATGTLLRSSAAIFLNCQVNMAVSWSRALTKSEGIALSMNPWQIFDAPSRPIILNTVAGGATYTITAAQGSYTLTGQAALLTKQSKMTAVQGSYTYTGQAALLTKQSKMTAVQGSYSLSGQAALLTKQSKLIAAQGSYSLSGQAAALTKQSKMTADQGSYTLSGQAVSFTYTQVGAYTMTANTGYFALTGQTTALTYTPVVPTGTTDTHDGFDPYARKRKAKGGKRKKEVEDLLAKLMGLVPEDAPEEIEQAVEVAKATVERISAPQVDYTDQIAALQTAQLQLAKLDALLRSYEDEEEDEDLLLMSM